MKLEQKQKAIYFRKQGLSINEIVQKVKVSKGSVSLWVRKYIAFCFCSNFISREYHF